MIGFASPYSPRIRFFSQLQMVNILKKSKKFVDYLDAPASTNIYKPLITTNNTISTLLIIRLNGMVIQGVVF